MRPPSSLSASLKSRLTLTRFDPITLWNRQILSQKSVKIERFIVPDCTRIWSNFWIKCPLNFEEASKSVRTHLNPLTFISKKDWLSSCTLCEVHVTEHASCFSMGRTSGRLSCCRRRTWSSHSGRRKQNSCWRTLSWTPAPSPQADAVVLLSVLSVVVLSSVLV